MAADATSGEGLLGRTAREVFDDHLRLGVEGTVDEDLRRNDAEDVVMLTTTGIHHGHDGVRRLSDQLRAALPNCTFHYQTRLIEGEFAFLEWTATSDSRQQTADSGHVPDGTDSYLIRGGRIVAQSIHYTVIEGGSP